ncbi:MAG TPA: hypothetical protein VFK33_00035 [Bacillales bacterium]|nr:hypothetical protein [Bacillales bacterium]
MQLQQRRTWLPIIASVGIGAAAYYSMTKGGGVGRTLQQMIPMMPAMSMGSGSGQNQPMQQQNQQGQQSQAANQGIEKVLS